MSGIIAFYCVLILIFSVCINYLSGIPAELRKQAQIERVNQKTIIKESILELNNEKDFENGGK